MSGFVHLHLHTEYSLLDGATRIASIADKAIACGQSAVAITDHGVMYGAVEFYNALKAKGVKPIIGCEVYVAPRSRHIKEGKGDIGHHLVLLCKNAEGYKNLCYMVSESFVNGFYSRPRIDMELLREHHEGLIALSGCVAGRIPQLILAGSMAEAKNAAFEMHELFGEDFYLEVQNHNLDEERKVAYGVRLISSDLGIPMVATNDIHYLDKSDAEVQATLMCVQMNAVITEGRPLGFENDEFYFKSTEEMERLFAGFDGAIENTVKIADKCNFDFEFNKLHLPDFKPEGGITHAEKLRLDAYRGFEERAEAGRFNFTKNPRESYVARLEYELSVIDKMGFNAYFLIVSDFVAYAKRSGIPVGPGRGSGAGSLVAFCVGITDVDPMEFDLLFERFLNSERVSMPDFDIDFCYNRREEVIDYVKRRYGDDKVAQIVTFGTLAPRAAVRDVGRALGMPYGTVDSIAKLIARDARSLDQALENKDLHQIYISNPDARKLIDVSRKVEGMPRHASTHAAGVVITERPTHEYVPLSYSGTGVVTQFDMNTDAALGLVKFDFLGLRYLTVIHDTEQLIKRRDPSFEIAKVSFDDRKTFELLCDGKTDGIFQLESGGMKAVLSRLCPSCLEDIIACVALYRPGPMDSIDSFIARKHGREKVVYKVDQLRDILDVTYGCIVYQEQVMQICRNLAGYSYAHADIVRRAMSKKKTSAMQAEREAFVNGCGERGISAENANGIFDEMVGFAKYAFNKSHATAYGVLSYRTAYLKAHYPTEYFTALMSSVLGNTTDIKSYIDDAKDFKVSVLPPDINESEADFAVVDGNIRFGLLAIKNVGRQFASAVVRGRSRGPYKSFDDFVTRMTGSDLNKRTVESLIKCGVFDRLGTPRSALMACYESIIEAEHEKTRSNISGQMDMFSMGSSSESRISTGYKYPQIPEFSIKDLLLLEKESSGMYFSGHMIDNYSNHISSLNVAPISDILNAFDENASGAEYTYRDRMEVKIAGIITAKKTKVTKNGETMAFLMVEDRVAEIEVVVFAKHYARLSKILSADNAVMVVGNISVEDDDPPRILLSDAKELYSNDSSPAADNKAAQAQSAHKLTSDRLFIKVTGMNDPRMEIIYRVAQFNRGNVPVIIYDESVKKYSAMRNMAVEPSEKVIRRLREAFGADNVILK